MEKEIYYEDYIVIDSSKTNGRTITETGIVYETITYSIGVQNFG